MRILALTGLTLRDWIPVVPPVPVKVTIIAGFEPPRFMVSDPAKFPIEGGVNVTR